jgi:hypothetical protein
VLLEFGLVRVPHRNRRLLALTAAFAWALVLLVGRAHAQVVEITPLPTESPSAELAPGTQWVYWMAIGAGVIVVLVLLAMAAGYMRFAPKFFGREEKPKAMPPGMRPPTLVRQAAQIRYTPPPASERAVQGAQAQARTATAVAERPAAAPSAAAEAAPAAEAASTAQTTETTETTETTTAPPEGEPAAEAEAPPAQAEAPPAQAEAPPAQAEAPPAQAEAPPAQAQPATAQPAPASQGAGGEMDQETFDRVLKEQIDRGVDRRVAEGRARAAAVVAARKKSQG